MWPSHIQEGSDNQSTPSFDELTFVINHALKAHAAKLDTDMWIEPNSHQVQFVHNWWCANGYPTLADINHLKTHPPSSVQNEQGECNNISTINLWNHPKLQLATPAISTPRAMLPNLKPIEVPEHPSCDDSGSQGRKYLDDVLEKVRQASSSSPKSKKSAGATHGRANAYNAMSSEHQNHLVKILETYSHNIMDYCTGANINPAHAFRYLHAKLPTSSLTEWQAFCQL